ncbi:MAG: hypothetical protein A2X59_07190 [Nitrospirae bacterium GWC2_42_7]|nr:MAG: hypothetical protein A2X59_07190 [Nitrospirae bacterium GWC2_42_7]
MAFKKKDIDRLLAAVGRKCCLCGSLHNVQVHHIVPKEDGGQDDVDNAIVLCPMCHDRVHVKPSSGRTTRDYTPTELKLHRDRSLTRSTGSGVKSCDNESRRQRTADRKTTLTLNVILSDDAKRDCSLFRIDNGEPIAFILREASHHPLIFHQAFTSMPFIFRAYVLYCSWDCTVLRIERLFSPDEAYPLTDAWAHCLATYRRATLLPYRTKAKDNLLFRTEERRTLNLYRELMEKTKRYSIDYQKLLGFSNQPLIEWDHIYEEAEFALAGDVLGVAIARLESLLSMIHKFLLTHIPTSRTRQPITETEFVQTETDDPSKISVLIVDDEPNNLELMKQVFRPQHYQCDTALSPREAMKALVARDYALIVTDIMMPFMDGREFVKAAKKCGSRAKIVVVTALSGMADQAGIGTAEFPVDAYFTKPLHFDKFLEEIGKILKNG